MSQITVIKQLPKPWKVGGKTALDIEVREPTVEDLCEAEKDANPAVMPTAFYAALAARLCVRAGDFTGPFAPAQFKGMALRNWTVVREALNEVETLGEDSPAGQALTG